MKLAFGNSALEWWSQINIGVVFVVWVLQWAVESLYSVDRWIAAKNYMNHMCKYFGLR